MSGASYTWVANSFDAPESSMSVSDSIAKMGPEVSTTCSGIELAGLHVTNEGEDASTRDISCAEADARAGAGAGAGGVRSVACNGVASSESVSSMEMLGWAIPRIDGSSSSQSS